MLQRLVSLSLIAGLTSAAFAQSTWYVDIHGTAPGTGTLADPYTSIQYAVERPTTINGDTILVAPGEYLESVDLATPSKWITLRSIAGPEVTTIRTNGFAAVRLEVATLDGFTLRTDNPQFSTGVEACQGNVRNCVITGMALGFYGCNTCSLMDSTLTGNMRAFDISVFEVVTIRNSIVVGNGNESLGHGATTVDHSIFSFAVPGTGNLIGDPSFWNPAYHDYRLKPGSIAIDAGNPASPLDPDGSITDIGAFTFDPNYAFGPQVYCTGKLSSQGCMPSIGASGACSASNPAPFLITASDVVDNKAGLLFYGFGARAQPFQGGLHCVQLPTKRSEGQFSGSNGLPPPQNFCSGAYSYDFNARIQSGLFANLVPGAVVYAQWWYRDPQDPQGFGTGLSDAIAVGIAP